MATNAEGAATTAPVGRDGRGLRVGGWRVLYRVDVIAAEITILCVLPRGRAYRD